MEKLKCFSIIIYLFIDICRNIDNEYGNIFMN